jgi:hypothetical protein
MARFCDLKAAECGEVAVTSTPLPPTSTPNSVSESAESAGAEKKRAEEGDAKKDVGRELADRVASEGGDCCVPKGRK